MDSQRAKGVVSGLNPNSLQARYEDLLREPPPHPIDYILLVLGVCMFCTCFLGFTRQPLSLHCVPCSLLRSVWLFFGMWCPAHLATMQHRKQMEKKNHPLPMGTKEFEAFEMKWCTPLPMRRKLAGLH